MSGRVQLALNVSDIGQVLQQRRRPRSRARRVRVLLNSRGGRTGRSGPRAAGS
jgi:hypothetical protein